MLSSATTSNVLKLEEAFSKVTLFPSAVAFSCTLPAILALLAAEIPSTVKSPVVLSPMYRLAAVKSSNSAAETLKSPTSEPTEMLLPLEALRVISAVPVLIAFAKNRSEEMIVKLLFAVSIAEAACMLPTPELFLSVCMITSLDAESASFKIM